MCERCSRKMIKMVDRIDCQVLFVCLGNICRSPTAEGVCAKKIGECDLAKRVTVDSCGTSAWHVGEPPDARATREAARRGYDLSPLRGRQIAASDFQRFDYILAMDKDNLAELQSICPPGFSGHLGLLLDFAPDSTLEEVPDPYYGGDRGFETVLDLIESACDGLLAELSRGGG